MTAPLLFSPIPYYLFLLDRHLIAEQEHDCPNADQSCASFLILVDIAY